MILMPGLHMLETEFPAPVRPEVLKRGLERIGIVIPGEEPASFDQLPPKREASKLERLRFLGRVAVPTEVRDTPAIHWSFARRIEASDPFADLSFQSQPYVLERGGLYELVFVAILRNNPSHEGMISAMQSMGWAPPEFSMALKKDFRMPGRPGASLTLWWVLAQWDKADSMVNNQDPFMFEQVSLISSTHLSPPTETTTSP